MGRSDRSAPEVGVFLRYCVVLLFLCATAWSAGCMSPPPEKTSLRVLPAGSLLIPFGEAEKEFESLYPGVDVQLEGHGSIQVIRQVTDLHRPVDVIAVADESLIPDLMYRRMEGSGMNYTDWYIPFAGNEMVIAYTGKSRYADEITPENWVGILSRPDVRIGIANPMLDASGYRALMVAQLAETEYQDDTIFEEIIGDHIQPRLDITTMDGRTTLSLPEIIRPADEKIAIRDGSIYLLSLLEAGGIDYAFEYKSVAEATNLSWVTLPPAINLGDEQYAGQYRNVTVMLGFQRFSSIGRERTGVPIVYAITVPNTAPHPELANAFVGYITNESGKGRPGWPTPLNRT
jgi:molybdate/tungstate transport system substrate-binding protein